MLTRSFDYETGFAPFDLFDEVRRRMGKTFVDVGPTHRSAPSGPTRAMPDGAFPRLRIRDVGDEIVVSADVPGLLQKDLEITLQDGVLTVSGARTMGAPDGYFVRRSERPSYRFSRSLPLPVNVDPDGTSARVDSGVLVVTLKKVAEAGPRKIVIR